MKQTYWKRKFIIFFFSSRRRHTRSYGDWSSDVCSSDLIGGTRRGQKRERREERERTGRHSETEPLPILARTPPVGYDGAREREPDLPQADGTRADAELRLSRR